MGNRLLNIDLVKIVAMFGVICLHTEMRFYENPLAQFLYMSSVVSIPMFFMTSGFLLYGKKSVSCGYSVHKIVGLLRFVLIITTIFWLLVGMRRGESFLVFTAGSLLQKGCLGIFWYLGSMIVIYSMLPMLYTIYVKHQKVFLIVTLVLSMLSNGIFIGGLFGLPIEEHTIQTFRLWNWLFYFNLGGIIRKYPIKSNLLLVVLLFVFNYFFQFKLTPNMPTIYCEYFYGSLPVMLLCFSLFTYMIKIDGNKLRFFSWGGKVFLPCYTLHLFIISRLSQLFENYIYESTLKSRRAINLKLLLAICDKNYAFYYRLFTFLESKISLSLSFTYGL